MTILAMGASGATGRHFVEQLLRVKIIVRSTDNIPENVINHQNSSMIRASVLDLSDTEMAEHVKEYSAVASLGHTLSFKGLFGPPGL